jgi:hypothetical protein
MFWMGEGTERLVISCDCFVLLFSLEGNGWVEEQTSLMGLVATERDLAEIDEGISVRTT